ncbi:MAG: PaaI family thioesterase [Piscinibacter sp.]
MTAASVPEGFTRLPIGGEFIVANGPIYERMHEGVCQLGFRVEARHTNTMGICHGGMMATFCDMLLPVTALRTHADLQARFLPTVSLDIDYLAPAPRGAWVQGEAQVLRVTRSLVFAQGLVSADGEPVARVSGVFKIAGGQRGPQAG